MRWQLHSSGTARAQISARDIVVNGTAEGSAVARDLVTLGEAASFTGEVRTARLRVDDGATLNGSHHDDPRPACAARATDGERDAPR